MAERHAAALAAVRHLPGGRVLVQDGGSDVTSKVLRGWMKGAHRLAGLKPTGNFHILRHTFCSHLAMQGAPARVVQELAGHTHLSTTMRYMHLAEGHKEQAIRLLDRRPAASDIARPSTGSGRAEGAETVRPSTPAPLRGAYAQGERPSTAPGERSPVEAGLEAL